MNLKKEYSNINIILKKKRFYHILLELKGGIICNGKFRRVDEFMNLLLEKALMTTKNGFYFKEIPLIFVKGTMIKIIQIV